MKAKLKQLGHAPVVFTWDKETFDLEIYGNNGPVCYYEWDRKSAVKLCDDWLKFWTDAKEKAEKMEDK
jgi:hypothetical protein